jgi:hypothetical protein
MKRTPRHNSGDKSVADKSRQTKLVMMPHRDRDPRNKIEQQERGDPTHPSREEPSKSFRSRSDVPSGYGAEDRQPEQ